MRWYASLAGACLLLHLVAGSADIEEGLNTCCEEGSNWGQAQSGCDGLPLAHLPTTQSCRIAQEICCRSALRERLCDSGKAAARGGRPCHEARTECAGDTYRDCCDGCRLGLAAAKEGAPCKPQTFSLGLPWDDAFYQCCSGRDDLPDDPAPPNNENDGECEEDNPCQQLCRIAGSEQVCDCHEGFRLDDNELSCTDIDECSEGSSNCDESRQQCMNTPGSFKCIPKATSNVALPGNEGDVPQCYAGFKYYAAISDCIDVDECSEGLDDCVPETQTCLNTHGGYQCLSKQSKQCPDGYEWKNDMCVDIDECLYGSHTCGSAALCVNTNGGFQCKTPTTRTADRDTQCPRGFRFNPHARQCQDVDECREGTHNCRRSTQRCENTNGGYSCRDNIPCPSGYRMDTYTRSCTDIDECAERLHMCPQRGTHCVNTPGSYSCAKKSRVHSCQPGFSYDPQIKGCKGGTSFRRPSAARPKPRCLSCGLVRVAPAEVTAAAARAWWCF